MRWASSIAVAVVIGLTLDSPATPMGVAAGRVALPGVMRLRGGFPGEKFLKKLGGHRNGGEENAAPPAADNTREMSKREMDFIARVQASAKKEEANTEALVATRNRNLNIQRIKNAEESGRLVGFENLGNTCFLNSVLINLVNTPPLRDAVLIDRDGPKRSHEGELTEELARVLREWWLEPTHDYITPSGLLDELCKAEPRFKGFQQQDAHEAFQALLEAVRVEQTGKGASASTQISRDAGKGGGAVHSVFEGQTESRVACRKYSHVSRTLERFVDLSVEIPDQASLAIQRSGNPRYYAPEVGSPPRSAGLGAAPPSIEDCLAFFCRQETLDNDGGTSWKCESCAKAGGDARDSKGGTKRLSIQTVPAVLVVHLKRFVARGGALRKSSAPVRLKKTLNLAPFLSPSLDDTDESDPEAVYELFGVVNHQGELNAGHYTAFVRQAGAAAGEWAYVSDRQHRPASEAEVLASEAYLLFYRRVPGMQ